MCRRSIGLLERSLCLGCLRSSFDPLFVGIAMSLFQKFELLSLRLTVIQDLLSCGRRNHCSLEKQVQTLPCRMGSYHSLLCRPSSFSWMELHDLHSRLNPFQTHVWCVYPLISRISISDGRLWCLWCHWWPQTVYYSDHLQPTMVSSQALTCTQQNAL